jgi:hypothetical protein
MDELTADQEHLLSMAEVLTQRAFEQVAAEEYEKRLWDFLAQCQLLNEWVAEQIAEHGEPMRVWLKENLAPAWEQAMERVAEAIREDLAEQEQISG